MANSQTIVEDNLIVKVENSRKFSEDEYKQVLGKATGFLVRNVSGAIVKSEYRGTVINVNDDHYIPIKLEMMTEDVGWTYGRGGRTILALTVEVGSYGESSRKRVTSQHPERLLAVMKWAVQERKDLVKGAIAKSLRDKERKYDGILKMEYIGLNSSENGEYGALSLEIDGHEVNLKISTSKYSRTEGLSIDASKEVMRKIVDFLKKEAETK